MPSGAEGRACICRSRISRISCPKTLRLGRLRRGAPARPALTGALLGLASAGGIAAGYALHCTEDSPLFFVSWYSLAILLVAGLGALAGRRVLHW